MIQCLNESQKVGLYMIELIFDMLNGYTYSLSLTIECETWSKMASFKMSKLSNCFTILFSTE